MVLEATMICVDNSEWMRNGDYLPTRLQAQIDAVNLISGAKTQSHAENTVGILTMAGKGVRVLITPTSDLGKILACTHGLEIGGEANIAAAVQVAQLALKHRQNKEQRQRIVLFCGSLVKTDKKALESIGKKLKKMNVALDVINFGEDDDGKPEKLESLVSAVNSGESSHIEHIPPGPNVLSDVLISSPIVTGDGEGGSGFAASAAAATGGMPGFEFGVDPNIDPELALALRVSMEEERARQEAAAKREAEEASARALPEAADEGRNSSDVSMPEATTTTAERGVPERDPYLMDDDKSLLDEALAMSMSNSGALAAGDTTMTDAVGEDQELAIALQMSMNEENSGGSSTSAQSSADLNKVLGDQMFVSSILASLPGVDTNDPSVRDVIAALEAEHTGEQKKDENDKKDGESH